MQRQKVGNACEDSHGGLVLELTELDDLRVDFDRLPPLGCIASGLVLVRQVKSSQIEFELTLGGILLARATFTICNRISRRSWSARAEAITHDLDQCFLELLASRQQAVQRSVPSFSYAVTAQRHAVVLFDLLIELCLVGVQGLVVKVHLVGCGERLPVRVPY